MTYLDFPKKILGFVIENWRVIVFLGLIVTIAWQREAIKKRDLKLSAAAVDLKLSQARVEQCVSVMDDLKTRGDAQAAELRKAAESANAAALRAGNAARAWFNAPVPKECAGAMQWQAAKAKEFGDGWDSGR